MDTFAPSVAPAIGGLSDTVTPRVLSAGFGDGYRQDAGDGLNALPRTAELSWNAVTVAVAAELTDFFEAHKGYLAFLWTMPGEATPRKWKCTTWNRSWPFADLRSVSAHFEQVFDL